MDMKKMLAALDGVESAQGTASGVAQKGSMKALLESLDSVVDEEETMEVESAGPVDNLVDEADDMDAEDEIEESFELELDESEDEDLEEGKELDLEEAIMVSAEGAEAAELLAILKNAGMPEPEMPAMPAMPEPEMEDTEYANSPDEETFGMDAVIASGDDLNKSKEAYADVDGGDNPMETFEGKFKAMLDEMLAEDEESTEEVEELDEAQSPAQKAAFEKMLAAKKGSKDEDEDEDEKVDESSEEVEEAADMGLSRFLKMAGI